MNLRALALVLLAVLPLSACAAMQTPQCPLPDQKAMQVTHLYFGRAHVSDAAWRKFETDVIAMQFPDGFTVTNGHGAWRDPASGRRSEEPSTIVTIAVPGAAPGKAQTSARIQAVRAAYKSRFHQISVGAVSAMSCGAF